MLDSLWPITTLKYMLKKLKTIFSYDRYFYGVLIILVVFIGQIPIILRIFHTPDGYYYPLLDKVDFTDYYYPAVINFGMGSDWLLKVPYVPSDHQGSLIQIFFILLGKLSQVTSIGPFEMYAIFRVIGGIVFAALVALFLKILLKPSRARWAFILFLFAQPLVWSDDGILTKSFGVWKWWWHYGEAARRISMVAPHYTLGKGLAILSLSLLMVYFQQIKPKYLILAGLSIFIAGIAYPPPVFIIFLSLSGALVTWIIWNKVSSLDINWKKIGGAFLYLFVSLLPLFILKLELAKGYPWDRWVKAELSWNDPNTFFEWGYIRMLGPLLLFVPLAIPKIFRKYKTNFFNFFILFWFVSPFLLFPVADMFSLSKFRLIEGAQIVPMAILGLWGLEWLLRRNILLLTFGSLFSIYFLVITSMVAYNTTLNLWSHWRNVYIHPEEQNALSYLKNFARKGSVVAADTYASSYIPAFARVRTIIGYPSAFEKYSDFQDEQTRIGKIMQGVLSEKEFSDYILTRKIDYLYYETFLNGEKKLYPTQLVSVFKNRSFEIYKVKK